ncbi:hypothetical protein HU200_033002 [Digitaria exilis]|uniref:Pectinesterase inhibitor domain-containing protein n=1 Tax=Digitaria exilis TaxID=1010633 RepID=A0A835ERY9_9POAL|nr:hypothetical protein HU200_033002 [Digitaria exilis]
MKRVQAIASLLFLLVCSTSTSSVSTTTVHDVCQCIAEKDNKPGKHDEHSISYDDCVKFFQADKGSATANIYGLAAIATKIMGETAKSVADRIAHLQASEEDKQRLACLDKCAEEYKDAAAGIREVAKGIASSDTKKRLGDAAMPLIMVDDALNICEEEFKMIHKPSPLATENTKFLKEVGITMYVTGVLH